MRKVKCLQSLEIVIKIIMKISKIWWHNLPINFNKTIFYESLNTVTKLFVKFWKFLPENLPNLAKYTKFGKICKIFATFFSKLKFLQKMMNLAKLIHF